MSLNIPPDTGLTDDDFGVWPDGTRVFWLKTLEQVALLARDDLPFDMVRACPGLGSFLPLVPYADRVKALQPSDALALDGLEQLQSLEWIFFSRFKFDYRQLPRLKRFYTPDASVIPAKFLNHANVEQLDVGECRIEKLSALSDMGRLRQLRLSATKTKSLEGVERLTALRELRMSNAGALTDIAALAGCADLQVLTFSGSKKLPDLAPLRWLHRLQVLAVNDSQAILDDVDWLADLPELRYLTLEAPVRRIDWAVVAQCASLEEVLLRVAPGSLAVDEAAVRQHFESAGRRVKEIRYIAAKPGFMLTLEPPAGVVGIASTDLFPAPFVLHKLATQKP